MTLITVYVMRQLAVGTFVVCGGLLSLAWLTQSLRYIELMVNQHVSVGAFLALTSLLLPSLFSTLLPFSVFIVTVFTYNKLFNDRETVVLQSVGLSPFQLARPALVFSVVMSILGAFFTIEVAPECMRLFKEKQWSLRQDISSLLIQEGMFSTISEGVTVYVRNRSSQGDFLDVMVHDTRDFAKTHTVLAERGSIFPTESGISLILHNARSHRVKGGTGHMELLDSERLSFEIDTPELSSETRYREASERSLRDLLSTPYSGSFRDAPRFWAEGLRRFFAPLSLITFTLIATAGLLSGRFERRGQKKHVMWTVVSAVFAQAGFIGSVHTASHDLGLIGLIPLSVILPTILAITWHAKAEFWQRYLVFFSRSLSR